MSLPELNSTIVENNVVQTTVQGGATLNTVETAGNTVETTVVSATPVYTTHNTVPIVETIITQDTQDITSVVEGFWDVVWSVNGQTGDVVMDIVLGDFTASTTYTKNAVIYYSGKIYKAKATFTSGSTFDASDWDLVTTATTPEVDGFTANHAYLQNEMIKNDGKLYTAKVDFTSGSTFDITNWDLVGGSSEWGEITGTLSNQTDLQTALDDKVTVVSGKGLSTNDYTAADKAVVDGLGLTTATRTLSNTTEWTDLDDFGLSTGTYAIEATSPSSFNGLWGEGYSGILHWYSSGTNSGNADELWLHNSGHADNSQRLYLRTKRNSRNTGDLKLQYAFAAGDGTSTGTFTFKFRRLI